MRDKYNIGDTLHFIYVRYRQGVPTHRNNGITLLELLIVISLTGLLFSLGIYPMLSQIRLIAAERAEISLFDEANLAVFYITRDAMRAKIIGSSGASTAFTIKPLTGPEEIIAYDTYGGRLTRNSVIITRKLNSTQGSGFWRATSQGEQHHLGCDLYFKDPDNPNITTRRRFDVMLRCRDAYK